MIFRLVTAHNNFGPGLLQIAITKKITVKHWLNPKHLKLYILDLYNTIKSKNLQCGYLFNT